MKFRYKNEADIPADVKGHYKQEANGDWVLQIEGAVDAARLTEFRDNNIRIQKDLDALKVKFEGIDPEEAKRLKTLEEDLQAGKLKGTKAEEILNQRTEEMRKAHEKKVAEITAERDARTAELARLKIADSAIAEGLKLGLRPTAKDDLAARVNGTFKLDKDGVPKAYDAQGNVIYGTDAAPMTVAAYVAGLTKNAEHLFDPSSGTGAGGGNSGAGGGGGGHTGPNPWKKETWNLTQQGQLVKTNRTLAETLAKQAGHTLPKAPAAR